MKTQKSNFIDVISLQTFFVRSKIRNKNQFTCFSLVCAFQNLKAIGTMFSVLFFVYVSSVLCVTFGKFVGANSGKLSRFT